MVQKEHKNFQIALFVLSIVNIVLAVVLVLVLLCVVLGHSIGTIFQVDEIQQETVRLINNVIHGGLMAIVCINFFSAIYSVISVLVHKSGFSIATLVLNILLGFLAIPLFHWSSILRWISRLLPLFT